MTISKLFSETGPNSRALYFTEDMHGLFILSHRHNDHEIHYPTLEAAKAESDRINALDIDGLQTTAFGEPFRIRATQKTTI